MWQCPKCGRKFFRKNQEHFCGTGVNSIDAYIADQDESVQPFLHQVRDTIRKVLPDAEERIAWHMHNIIHFAAFKNHMGIYPGDKAIEHFADELADYKTSKGAWQPPYKKPLPLPLIAEIAQWCYETGNHH